VARAAIRDNLDVWRPCDVLETAVAWRCAVERRDGPSAIVLTRQNTLQQAGDQQRGRLAARGGYVLADAPSGAPDVIIIATGSEVSLAIQAREQLAQTGVAARVVSMPSTTMFDRQDEAYRRSVLPEGVRRLAVEAAASDSWWKHVGLDGEIIGIDRFGESAPGAALFTHFGFTTARITEAAARLAA
jgi:transketolase